MTRLGWGGEDALDRHGTAISVALLLVVGGLLAAQGVSGLATRVT
jgi:hypothetical protein